MIKLTTPAHSPYRILNAYRKAWLEAMNNPRSAESKRIARESVFESPDNPDEVRISFEMGLPYNYFDNNAGDILWSVNDRANEILGSVPGNSVFMEPANPGWATVYPS